jgi:zinc transport system ATP-binding protein
MNAATQPFADAAPALAVSGLSVRLGDYTALEGIDLTLPAGAFMTIIGPNGGGKTTLLGTVLGLIEPLTGQVRVWGLAPRRVDPRWIGHVPQLKTLDRRFPARAEELVATGLLAHWPARLRPEERERVRRALEQVDGTHLARRALAALSGGELQRVYLARAIVRRPRLILLDEPAAGMDVTGEADMYGILEQYQAASGATIVMITHDWDAARHHATHVLVLNRHLIGFGPPGEALSEHHLERAFGHVGHPHREGHPRPSNHPSRVDEGGPGS